MRLAELFSERPVGTAGPIEERLYVRQASGDLEELPALPVPAPVYCSSCSGQQEGQSLQSWKLAAYAPGLSRWWCFGDLVCQYHAALAGEKVPRWVLNVWTRLCKHLEFFGPPHLLVQKGLDKRGRTKHWRRCLVETSCNTTGILAALCIHMVEFREPDPVLVEVAAQEFLASRFKEGEEFELLVPLDREYAGAYCAPGAPVPPALAATLVTSGPFFFVQPFLSQAEDNEHAHLDAMFKRLFESGRLRGDVVPMATLLRELYSLEDLRWLARALVHQLARTMEAFEEASDFSDNPLEHTRMWGFRVDAALNYHLLEGRGVEGSSSRTPMVDAHLRSFHFLRKKHKRWGKRPQPRPSRRTAEPRLQSRYLEACRQWVRQSQHLCMVFDATRVGQKEILLCAILGTLPSGEQKAMWCPPQVPPKK